jgi:hypothetical protein
LTLRDDEGANPLAGLARSIGIGGAPPPVSLPAAAAAAPSAPSAAQNIAGQASDIGTAEQREIYSARQALRAQEQGLQARIAGASSPEVAKIYADQLGKLAAYDQQLETAYLGTLKGGTTHTLTPEEMKAIPGLPEGSVYQRNEAGALSQVTGTEGSKKELKVIGEDQFGNKTYGTFDPDTGEAKPLAAAGGGAQSQGQGALDLHGPDFIKTLPPNIAGQVTAIVEGRAPYPTGMLLRTPYGQQLAAMVTQADPTFESGNATARVAARKEFESGGPNSVAGTITSGNAAIKHLGELSDDAEALNNKSLPVWNAIANAYETQTGDARITNFNNTIGRFGEEATKFYRGIGGSEADVQRDIANLSPNMSPEQLRGAVQKQANLMRDKIVAYQDRWHKVMGPMVPDFQIVDPTTQNVLDKLDTRAGGARPVQGSAPAQASGQRLSPADAAKLPSGTRFIGEDGVARVRH